jgi:hypothetical protein
MIGIEIIVGLGAWILELESRRVGSVGAEAGIDRIEHENGQTRTNARG